MRTRTPWLERRFDTDTPPEMFANLLERLRGTPARVEDRLSGVEPSRLTVRPSRGWSVLENVGHLLQVEELWSARLDDFQARRPALTPARFESGRVEEAKFNEQRAADLLSAFRGARARLVGRLEGLDDEVLEIVARHPRLDRPMRLVDLMAFIAEHDDHHLAAITYLLGV